MLPMPASWCSCSPKSSMTLLYVWACVCVCVCVQLSEEHSAALIRSSVAEVEAWFSRLDCLVVGPGLGRDTLLLDIARACLVRARLAGLPLVLDGDALFLVAREPELVQGTWGGVPNKLVCMQHQATNHDICSHAVHAHKTQCMELYADTRGRGVPCMCV